MTSHGLGPWNSGSSGPRYPEDSFAAPLRRVLCGASAVCSRGTTPRIPPCCRLIPFLRTTVSFEDRQDLLGHNSTLITTHYSAAELERLIAASANALEKSPTAPRRTAVPGFAYREVLLISKNQLVPAEGVDPPTNGLQSSDRELHGRMYQPLAALASPDARCTKAQSRHTQSGFGTFPAQPDKPQSHRSRTDDQTAIPSRTALLIPSRAGACRARSGAAQSI